MDHPSNPVPLAHLVRLESDLTDAEELLRAVRTLADLRGYLGHSLTARTLKEILWFKWEQPRLPRPLVDGKYPKSYPWSTAAREIYGEAPKRADRAGMLVIEHVEPKRHLIEVLVREAGQLTVERTLGLLRAANTAVIISKAEDALLTRSGYASRSPDPEDPWSRYRVAGLDPAGFSPLVRLDGP